MLPDKQLSDLRADLETLLTDTVTVQRAVATSDGAGGQVLTWSEVGTVRGMLAPARLRPEEQVIAERTAVLQWWTLSVPAGADIKSGDRIVIGDRTFEVLAVRSGTFTFLKRLLVSEVT